jgi:putative ABC transport system permease protein
MMDAWLRLRQVLRTLAFAPQYTTLAVLTLSIGIGGNLAMFAALDRLFLRPLPFRSAEELVRIRDVNATPDGRHVPTNVLDTHLIELLTRAQHSFAGFAAADDRSMTLTDSGLPLRVNVISTAAGAFDTLGVTPSIGRLFTLDEERTGAEAGVVVISHRLWTSHFGGRIAAVGESIRLDDRTYRIVGVLRPGFRFPWEGDAWIPERLTPTGRRDYAVFGRLLAGASLKQASLDLTHVADAIKAAHPEILPGYGFEVQPLRDSLMEGHQRVAQALSVLVVIFLAIACANVTNLQLARVVARQRELAVRAALGASAWARISAVLGESLVIAGAGTIVGLLIALWLSTYFSVLVPTNFIRELGFVNEGVDRRLLSFAIVVCSVSGLLCGLLPAMAAQRTVADRILRYGGRGLAPASRRALGGFVVAQVALATMLLAAATVVARDFAALAAKPFGIDAEHVASVSVALPPAKYSTPQAKVLMSRRIIEAVDRIPGIDNAAISTINPFAGSRWVALVQPEGRTNADSGFAINHRLVSPGFLQTWRLPLLAGRPFSDDDDATGQPVAIVSDRLAQHFWPNGNAVGRRLRSLRAGEPWRLVVGVVGDVADQGELHETWYVPYPQGAAGPFADAFDVMAHSRTKPDGILLSMTSAIQSTDKGLPVYEPAVLSDQLEQSLLPNKLGAIVVVVLSGFGLTLALIGTYGVSSYIARSGRHDTALRIMLGASARTIASSELQRTFKFAGAGVAIGVVGASLAGEAVRQVLGVSYRTGSGTVFFIGLLLLVVTILAGVLPAIRASHVPPADALRAD